MSSLVARTTLPLNTSELSSETEKSKRNIFNESIKELWGTSVPDKPSNDDEYPATHPDDVKEDLFEEYEDGDESPWVFPDMNDPINAAGNAINQQPVHDKMIQDELIIPQGDKLQMAKVCGRTVGPDGKTIGTFHDTPIFNSIVYDVEFTDGEVKEYSANVIDENMHSQVDNEGFTLTLLDTILDFKQDEQYFSKDEQYATTKRGCRRLRKTTCVWKLLV